MRHTADIVKGMLGKPYKLGGCGDGLDCLSMFLGFCDAKGITLPDEWQGITRENYAELWAQGKGRDEMYEFLHSLGAEVEDRNYLQKDDIILLAIDMGDSVFSMPAIYLGNGHLLLVLIETGAVVVPLWSVKDKIFEVRRLG